MSQTREAASLDRNSDQFEDLVFTVFENAIRRKMLMSLARESSQMALNFDDTRHPDLCKNVIKHLIVLRKAGFVTMADNPRDGRRALYSLAPSMTPVVSDSNVTFHFSFPAIKAEVSIHSSAGSNNGRWKEDQVFWVLRDRCRRRLLFALIRGGPKPAVDLTGAAGRSVDGTLKRLGSMRARGWVTMSDNPKDGRRGLYALSPDVPVTTAESGKVIDFGFCVLRLGIIHLGIKNSTQGRRDAETQRRRDAETQRRRDAETQRRRDAETQRRRDAGGISESGRRSSVLFLNPKGIP